MYLAPWASSAFLIAASSVFQRSSWKFDHETPTVTSFAIAAKETKLADASKTAPIAKFFNDFMCSSRTIYGPGGDARTARAPPAEGRTISAGGTMVRPADTVNATNGLGVQLGSWALNLAATGDPCTRRERPCSARPGRENDAVRGAPRPFDKRVG